MTYCHNLYHAPQGGMMAMLSYQTRRAGYRGGRSQLDPVRPTVSWTLMAAPGVAWLAE